MMIRFLAYCAAVFIIYLATRYLIMGYTTIEQYSFWFGFSFSALCGLAYSLIVEASK